MKKQKKLVPKTKVCTGCSKRKNLEKGFTNNPEGKYGKYSKCRKCRANYAKKYKEQNPDRIKQLSKESYLKHKDKINLRGKEYYKRKKSSIKKKQQKYYKNNKLDFYLRSALRRARKLRACPIWSDLQTIKEIYKNCPSGHHVDHIVPLQGEIATGLHVPDNLQYLTPSENNTKSNKWPWPEDLYEDKFKLKEEK